MKELLLKLRTKEIGTFEYGVDTTYGGDVKIYFEDGTFVREELIMTVDEAKTLVEFLQDAIKELKG